MRESDDLLFESIVQGYVEENPRFVRRDWLATQLNEKLGEPRKRFVLLTAEPGAGKSVFIAQLAHDHLEWLRYFIRRDQREVLGDVSDKSLLLRIGYQLAARHPELFTPEQLRLSIVQKIDEVADQGEVVGAEVKRLTASPFYQKVIEIEQQVRRNQGRMVGLRVEELVVESRLLSAEDLVHLALIHPAQALQRADPKQRIVILIDALDEIRYHSSTENILAWLTNCPALPDNIRFVLTSRPPDQALKNFCAKQASRLSQLTIAEEDPRVLGDIEQFVKKLVGESVLNEALAAAEGGAAAFAAKATAKAHGNLGYLDALARGLDQALARKDAKALQALLNLKELPADLKGLYAFFLHQIKHGVEGQHVVGKDSSGNTFSTEVWPAVYEPILGVLAVAVEPIESELIAKLGDIVVEFKWVPPALNRLHQFLEVVEGSYRLYHSTVPEFLTSDSTRDNPETADLYQDAQQRHRQIASHYATVCAGDWDKCDDYGLTNLAGHLYQGKQFERLDQLISQEWMHGRIARAGNSTEGFIADVELAWRAALREEEDQERAIVKCLRYALIRTSFNSISVNYPPSLVARALEDELWTSERAFSLAASLREHAAVDLWVEILATGRLDPATSRRAESLALQEAQAIRDPSQRVRALTKIAHSLDGEAKSKTIQEGLRVTQEISAPNDHVDAVAELAPFLEGEEKSQLLLKALMAVKEVRDIWEPADDRSWARSSALARLSPQLTQDLAQRALEIANSLSVAGARAAAQVALLPRLPAQTVETVVGQVLEVVRGRLESWRKPSTTDIDAPDEAARSSFEAAEVTASPPPGDCVHLIQSLAPFLTRNAKEQLLREGIKLLPSFDHEPSFRWRFEIAPLLNHDLALPAVESARRISNPVERAKVFANLALLLSSAEKQRLLIETVDMLRDADAIHRLRGLVAWLPHSEDPPKQGLLRDILRAAEELAPDAARDMSTAAILAAGLGTALPLVSGPLMQTALDLVLAPGLRPFRDESLKLLAQRLSGSLLQRALHVSVAIEDNESRVMALSAIAPHLAGIAKEETLQYALAQQCRFFSYRRAKALAKLAIVLEGPDKERALLEGLRAAQNSDVFSDLALAELAPQLTGTLIDRGVEAARQFSDSLALTQSVKTKGLAIMASKLSGEAKQELIGEVFNALQKMDDSRQRGDILLRLTPALDGQSLKRGWMEAQELDDSKARAESCVEIARRLSGHDRDVALSESQKAARAIAKPADRAAALARLARELTTDSKKRTIADALGAALGIKEKGLGAEALTALVPILDGTKKRRVSRMALELLEQTEGCRQIEILSSLALELDGELLDRAARMAESIAERKDRSSALCSVAVKLIREAKDGKTRTSVLVRVADWLFSMREISRPELLYFCTGTLFAPTILSQGALGEIALCIREISEEWSFDGAG